MVLRPFRALELDDVLFRWAASIAMVLRPFRALELDGVFVSMGYTHR